MSLLTCFPAHGFLALRLPAQRPTAILCALFVLMAVSPSISQADDQTVEAVRIGVLAFEGREAAHHRWQPTAELLSREIPGYRFQISPLNHPEFEHAINQGLLDFVLTNPAHHAQLTVNFGISSIATFIANPRNQPQARFSAVLFTRADSEITGINELPGTRLAAVSEGAFGGYQLARELLLRHGIDTRIDLETSWYGFPHAAVVQAVLSGRADVGTVRSGVLESMADQGELSLKEIRVLAARSGDGYPLLHSVDLYPEWPFSRLPNTDTALSRKVALALMAMSPLEHAARRSEGAGWTIPLSDRRVHAVLQRLEIAPYERKPLKPAVMLEQYGPWLAVVLLLLITSLSALLALILSNRRLQASQSRQQHLQLELQAAAERRSEELDNTRQLLDDSRHEHITMEHSMDSACDAISALHALLLREELSAEQRMAAMVDAVRHQLGADIGLLSRKRDDTFELRSISPADAEPHTPLWAEEAAIAIESRRQHQVFGRNPWREYIACPVFLEGELHCLLEFAVSDDDGDASLESQTGAELARHVLNLVAQWIAQEIQRHEDERADAARLADQRACFSSITPRERDVLLRLVRGESNKEIARNLGLSPKTVEMHRANLLRKTGMKSSTELVRQAVSSRLFNDDVLD